MTKLPTIEEVLNNPENFELVPVYKDTETREIYINRQPFARNCFLAGFMIKAKQYGVDL